VDRKAFKARPLVFLRGVENESDQWVALEDCIWTRSVLQSKHVLISSLRQYGELFRETLEVPNATREMLVTEFLEVVHHFEDDENEHIYAKELLQELARPPWDDEDLERLSDEDCWPCRTPDGTLAFFCIGDFYVNDRQDLYKMFADTHTFLDCTFETSKRLTDLLRSQDCESFLSESVLIDTECLEPLSYDRYLTADFRSRADCLVK
jgi:hypothetical protein